jgi:nicotinate dehydrogenase subunit B
LLISSVAVASITEWCAPFDRPLWSSRDESASAVTTPFYPVIATFALNAHSALAQSTSDLPLSLGKNRRMEGWIRRDPDNSVVVFTGKAELGQGILTALAQIAAEELDVDVGRIRMVSADTSRGPDEQYTFGSQSIEQSGGATRAACAEARAILLEAAARRFQLQETELKVIAGTVFAADDRRATYWEVASGEPEILRREITGSVQPKRPADYRIVGKSFPRGRRRA